MFARIGDDPDAKELIDKLDDHKEMNQWIDCLPGGLICISSVDIAEC